MAFSLVAAYTIWLCGNLGGFGLNKISFDVITYHAYIPATFVKKDLSLKFFHDSTSYYSAREMYWAKPLQNGKCVIKTTYGLSLMNLPFMAIPLLFSNHSTGYELPFSMAIAAATLFYFLAGMFFSIKLLKLLNFNSPAIALSIIAIGLGTNYLAYTAIAVGMPHCYNYFLLVTLLYYTLKWFKQPSNLLSIAIGLLFGLLILNRPTNVIFILCFLFYNNQLFGTKEWPTFIKTHALKFIIMSLCGLLVLIPQLLYWKYSTGSYFFNSYVGEKFFFNNPHILNFLFGFRKGWFIYTPLICFALYGLWVKRKENPFFIASLICLVLLIYLSSSWWCWWFGGGYSARSMIEFYPLLLIGFASFFSIKSQTITAKRIVTVVFIFLTIHNIKSVDLYRRNRIHFDSMTWESYKYNFFKYVYSDEEAAYNETLQIAPNYEKARLSGEE